MTTILIATDGSVSAERAVHVGTDVARSRHADVVLLSVIDDSPIPDSIRVMSETEHVVDAVPQPHEANISNIPSWVMEGVHSAAQAEENIDIRTAIARVALEKARFILGEAGITPSEEIVEGDATKAILETAARDNAEMIIMGTRGLGSLKSLVYGSTSKSVAEHAECCCITVT